MITIKKIKVIVMGGLLSFSVGANAALPVIDMGSIAQAMQTLAQLQKEYELLLQAKKISEGQLSELKNQLAALTGNHHFGTREFQSLTKEWGEGTGQWQNTLNSYQAGSGSLSQLASQLQDSFPLQTDYIQQQVKNPRAADYYALQAKTTLTARAASQMTFDSIDKKMQQQERLLRRIDETQDVKSALEQLSRLQAENNLIQLQMLRMLAMQNQQTAVRNQAVTEAALANAKFLKMPNRAY